MSKLHYFSVFSCYLKLKSTIEDTFMLKFTKIIINDKLTQTDINALINKWKLDSIIFEDATSSAEVARFIPITSSELTDAKLLVTFEWKNIDKLIEHELIPVYTIFNSDFLLIATMGDLTELKQQYRLEKGNPIDVILRSLLIQAAHLKEKLAMIKTEIDRLDKAARETTKTKELKKVTTLTRELVVLKHALDDQTETLKAFCDYLIKNKLAEAPRINVVMTQHRRITKRIHVYTDLLNSISGLFTAMMDSHLNNLMKYLDSTALVIAIPALISGIWGMNIGGLPGKNDEQGFWILFTATILLTLIWYFFLRRKKYND